MPRCRNCGNKLWKDDTFCSMCGTSVAASGAGSYTHTHVSTTAGPITTSPFQQSTWQQTPTQTQAADDWDGDDWDDKGQWEEFFESARSQVGSYPALANATERANALRKIVSTFILLVTLMIVISSVTMFLNMRHSSSYWESGGNSYQYTPGSGSTDAGADALAPTHEGCADVVHTDDLWIYAWADVSPDGDVKVTVTRLIRRIKDGWTLYTEPQVLVNGLGMDEMSTQEGDGYVYDADGKEWNWDRFSYTYTAEDLKNLGIADVHSVALAFSGNLTLDNGTVLADFDKTVTW